MSERPKRIKTLTPEEVDALDPAFIDSVTADRLIATVRSLREGSALVAGSYAASIHAQVALWLASVQGEWDQAEEWLVNGVDQWIGGGEIATDPWAHDWRKFWNSRSSATGEPADDCMVCGDPATIWSGTVDSRQAACGDRHWKALKGELTDEQCRLCNQVTVCAHDLAGSPVCADCWPGERLLADRRAAWSARFATAATA